jgi:hypothetical protein
MLCTPVAASGNGSRSSSAIHIALMFGSRFDRCSPATPSPSSTRLRLTDVSRPPVSIGLRGLWTVSSWKSRHSPINHMKKVSLQIASRHATAAATLSDVIGCAVTAYAGCGLSFSGLQGFDPQPQRAVVTVILDHDRFLGPASDAPCGSVADVRDRANAISTFRYLA